jgi:hypothetical protein
MFSTTKTRLTNIVGWLRADDESSWEDQIASLSQAISDFADIAHPTKQPDGPQVRSTERDIPPETAGINAAMPHLQNMLRAMQGHDREASLKDGEEALEFLPEN